MEKLNYTLDVDYKAVLGTWFEPLSEFLKGSYMHNMMIFLHEAYKIKDILPEKEKVFKVFHEVSFSDVRVIVIGDEPYHDYSNTGIAYGQSMDHLVPNNEIIEIETAIEKTCYDNFNLHIDSTLSNWVEQGVLPIHASLTVENGIKGSHKLHWRSFIRNLIQVINEHKPGTIFMLWGEDAKYYRQFINADNNYILESESVHEQVAKGYNWESSNFAECNKILEKNNGREFVIEW